MRICHLSYSIGYGGVETLLVNVANWQSKLNHHVTVIVLNDVTEKELLGELDQKIDFINLKRKLGSKSIFFIFKLNYILFKNKFDAVHVHFAGMTKFILGYFKKSIVLHIHSTKNITNYGISNYQKCIVISKSVKNAIETQFNIFDSQILYNGINFDRIKKKTIAIKTDKIISVGRIDNKFKNQEELVKEFSNVQHLIKANLYIVGDGPDMDLLSHLRKKLKLERRLFLLGKKPQRWIYNNLHKYDLFIQSSLSEGLGISAIEASAACVPLILSNIDGHKEIGENGKLCQTYNKNTPGELGKEIIWFYENFNELSKTAFESYNIHKSKFDFESYNKKIISAYQSMIEDSV